MKKISRLTLAIGGIFLAGSVWSSESNTDHPTTFLGPTLRTAFTNTFNDTTAYNIAAEFGVRNFRLGGSLGFQFENYQRFKLSVEYLRQNITNPFFDGNSDQWIQQGSLGADYEFVFADTAYYPSFNIYAFLSHAPSKNLRTDTFPFANTEGTLQPLTDTKRIAGSNAGGLSPGITFTPWQGGRVGAEVNYDIVRYDTTYAGSQNATGFGGTAHLNQTIATNVDLYLQAAVRQPFNNYQANLAWSSIPYYGYWTLGINYEYNLGKNTLPSTYNVILDINYSIDPTGSSYATRMDGIDNFMNASDNIMDMKGVSSLSQQAEKHDFLSWTSRQPGYMPQVLAIPEEKTG
jgi:hypothetical protein